MRAVTTTPAVVFVALLIGLAGGTPRATAQSLPTPVPPPVEHPAYSPVKALIERGQRCAAEVPTRQAAVDQARGKLFLTQREHDDNLAHMQRALQDAAACPKNALRELLEVALPNLEAACVESRDRPCAQWAQNQRIWRSELEAVKNRMEGCSETRNQDPLVTGLDQRSKSLSGPSYTDPGSRTVEQQTTDLDILRRLRQQAVAAAQAAYQRCVAGNIGQKMNLEMALAGRDPASEVGELMLATQTLVGSLSPELTFDSFRESLSKLTEALGQATMRRAATRSEACPAWITSAVDALKASESAWGRERGLQPDVERLTQERDAALASYAQRVQGGLDIAQGKLKFATENLDRARQERATAWRTAEGLVKKAVQPR
jgi:hypothetical protein